ncbi:MAG: glycosyl transferase, partial [bacterium]|nr:glycosyl transferase [bacterium]
MDRKVNNKLNIGIVTTWFERGAAYVSRAYMKTLANKHDVWIYVRGGEEYAQGNSDWDDVNIWWGKRRRIGVPQYIDWGDFQDWIRQHHIDVIIFNEQQSWDVILRCRN